MTDLGEPDRDEARIAEEMKRATSGIDPFAAAVRATRMPMVITNPRVADNPIVFANDAFCVLTGYARDEIVGRNCRFLQGADTDAGDLSRIREAVASGLPLKIDLRNFRRDGTPFWNRLLMAPVRNVAGEVTFFFASQIDVTLERERLDSLEGENASLVRELAARLKVQEESEARLRQTSGVLDAILASAPALIYAKDREGRMLVANEPALKLIGRPWREVRGRRDSEILPDTEQGLVIEDTDRRIMAEGVTREIEEVVSARGQEPQLWLSTKSPMRDGTGAITGLVGVSIDITDRKRTEKALQDLNATLEMRIAERTRERDRAWRLSQNLLVVCDLEGVIVAASPAWTATLGWTEQELVGEPFRDFIHPDDKRATTEAARDVASHSVEQGFENRYLHKDGSHRWFSWSWVVDGELVYSTGRDITAEKRQKAALAQVEARLMQSQKMEAIGQLTGGIAHDFNNMLQGISGSLELMERRIAQGAPEQAARYVEEALKAVERAAGLTHRLLAFARRQTLAPKPVEPCRLLDGIAELIRRTVGPQVAVEVVGDDGAWMVSCDPNQLESALINLAINARDAMPDAACSPSEFKTRP